MVYYRKYRPQKINELDNAAVRASLQAIFRSVFSAESSVPSLSHYRAQADSLLSDSRLSSKRTQIPSESSVPHAFLFTGPKGLGKTSSARIVAKVANCISLSDTREDGFEPCNTCEVCLSITNGTNMDVLEIDAASNRGIDEIRDLKEKIRLSPLSAKKKVYIIDEVHMLTTEAFNALLKTLEEPPSHALFILCTTEAHKLPETIVSRCFHVAFSHATEAEMVRSLRRVVEGEKLDIPDDALAAVASVVRKMHGGFRDATKMLEEVVLLADGTAMTKEWFEQRFPAANVFMQVISLLKALQSSDMKSALGVVSVLSEQGVDIRFFLSEVLEELHRRLLVTLGIGEGLQESSEILHFEVEEIRTLSNLFSKAYTEMKNSVLPQLPLELAIVDACMGKISDLPAGRQGSRLQISDSLLTSSKDERNKVADRIAPEVKEVSVDALRKQVGMINKQKALYGEDKTQDIKIKGQEVQIETVNLMDVPGAGEMTKEWLGALWRGIISEMKQYNHTIAGVLRSCTIAGYSDSNLVIATAYAFHKERLDDMKTKTALVKVCKILTGKEVEVTVELKK
jgi:DNA polymerase-3 subunit gamma/tau